MSSYAAGRECAGGAVREAVVMHVFVACSRERSNTKNIFGLQDHHRRAKAAQQLFARPSMEAEFAPQAGGLGCA